MKKGLFEYDEIIKTVYEVEILVGEDRFNNASIEDKRKNYPDKIVVKRFQKALNEYIVQKGLKISKTDFPDNKWMYLSNKLAYPYEYFTFPDEY